METKRLLTESEIQHITSFIQPVKGIPKETAMSLVTKQKMSIRQQLEGVNIFPSCIPKLTRMIKNDYYATLVRAGESVGVISGQSIGEKQTQKNLNSVDWTDKIIYEHNGCIRVEPIGQLIDRMLVKSVHKVDMVENKTEYLKVDASTMSIPSCDKNGNLEWLEIEAVTRHPPGGKLVKVTTQSGRIVSASQAKSFLTWNGEVFVDTLGSALKVGDILPTTSSLVMPKHIVDYLDMGTIKAESRYPFPKKMILDQDFGFIFGIYLCGGRITTKTYTSLECCDLFTQKRVTDWCNEFRVSCHVVTATSMRIHSSFLTKVFNISCGRISTQRHIPEFAYNAPIGFIKGLLDGYFSGIGLIRSSRISTTSDSKDLITGISLLLSYFGVFSKISENKLRTTLYIKNMYVQIFSEHIYLTNRDLNTVIELYAKKNVKHPRGKRMKNFPHDRDVHFDRVVKIEYVEATNGVVYDFTVEKTRNFMLWNGLNVRDTFHRAGSSENSSSSASKFAELVSATKNPSAPTSMVYFKNGNSTIAELIQTIGSSIVELTFGSITKSWSVHVNKERELWYDSFEILHNSNFTRYTDCVSLKINIGKLFQYGLTMRDIAIAIDESGYDDMTCIYSPDSVGQVDIFIDTSTITLPDENIAFVTPENAREIYLDEVVTPFLSKIQFCGIKGLKEMYFLRDGNKWMIETDGSNFQELLTHPDVDAPRVLSSNLWDIYHSLGIEATRQFMIDEFTKTMDGINACHAMLLTDFMTFKGTVSPINRFTMRTQSPLTSCTFEENVDNIRNACLTGAIDDTRGVSAKIICGVQSLIGTGAVTVEMDMDCYKTD